MIDYQEIIENLKEEDVFHLLEELGARPIDKGNHILCKTICHNEDADEASSKLYYYKDTHLFYCYTECGAQSIFKFLKNYYECRGIVYDWYKDILQVVLNCSAHEINNVDVYKTKRANYEPQKIRTELPEYPEGILDCFVKFYPIEWLEDGISKEAMDKYKIRYSPAQNKIIIPHYDINKRLVGIRSRALNQYDIETFGKYMPIQIEGKWYSHPLSLNLYGLDKNANNILKYRIAFIFESEKSVLQFEHFPFPNCAVASCGSNLNKFQVDQLVRLGVEEIVVCYDNEELKGEDKYFKKLYETCKKYNRYCKMSFIYDREHLGKLKDSPSDNGWEIFKKLLNKRVQVK